MNSGFWISAASKARLSSSTSFSSSSARRMPRDLFMQRSEGSKHVFYVWQDQHSSVVKYGINLCGCNPHGASDGGRISLAEDGAPECADGAQLAGWTRVGPAANWGAWL